MPISTYRIVHTGPNTQAGGAHAGSEISRYSSIRPVSALRKPTALHSTTKPSAVSQRGAWVRSVESAGGAMALVGRAPRTAGYGLEREPSTRTPDSVHHGD